MKHLNPTQLSAHLDRVLSGRAVQVVEYHLEVCEECRRALAELEAQDRALSSAAEQDPGDAYFESFADRVESRIRAAEQGAPGARAHHLDRAPEGGLLGWLPATRRLAIASAVAVVVVGGALVLVTARQSEMPSMQRPDLAARDEQVAQQSSPSAEMPPEAESGWRRSPAVAPLEEKRERERARQNVAVGEDDRKDAAAGEGAAGSGAARTSQLAAENQSSTATPSAAKSSGASRATKVRAREEGQTQTGSYGFSQPPAPAPAPSNQSGKLNKPAPTPLSDAVGQIFRKERSPSQRNAAPLTAAESTALRGARDVGAESAPVLSATGERGRVCGRVVDNRGRPIVGAEAAIAEFGLSTVTGKDGRFCMDVPSGQRTLVVMSIGFETARRPVEVGTGTMESNVTLQTIPVLDAPGKPRAVPRLRVGDPPAIDTFSTWPSAVREAARSAQRQHDRAAQLKTAVEFDHAAADWSRVLPQVRGGPHELLVRDRLADARFRAWEAGPTPDRSALAIEALTAYVGRAPQGSSRTQAAKRLDRVKR